MRRQIILRMFLFLLFAGYICAANMFPHIHIENGETITHSHPHQNKHSHDEKQYQIIKDLTHISFYSNSIDISFNIYETELKKETVFYQKEYLFQKIRNYYNKGSPLNL